MSTIRRDTAGQHWRVTSWFQTRQGRVYSEAPSSEAAWNEASARIDEFERHWRKRRGRWVEIPTEWVGKFPTKKTLRERKRRRL